MSYTSAYLVWLLINVALVAVATAKGDHDDDHKYHDRDRKDGKGGCRGKGKHPNGRHGSKGEREGHKGDKYERYLKDDLMVKEAEWERDGKEGPTSAEATKLMADCLVAAEKEDIKSPECVLCSPLHIHII